MWSRKHSYVYSTECVGTASLSMRFNIRSSSSERSFTGYQGPGTRTLIARETPRNPLFCSGGGAGAMFCSGGGAYVVSTSGDRVVSINELGPRRMERRRTWNKHNECRSHRSRLSHVYPDHLAARRSGQTWESPDKRGGDVVNEAATISCASSA